ncbi:MAG: allantoicase [Candidatus Acidiferrales bacterium]
MNGFTELIDLAAERLGGTVLHANDDFFAPKENLLKAAKPIFIEDKYTDRGKWMDGWETRRRRSPGHDWCVIRLGLPGILRGLLVDTAFFRGYYPECCSMEACAVACDATADQLDAAATRWYEVLKSSPLKGDSQNLFPIDHPNRVTHLRFHIYPDGGVARLRAFGEVVPDWEKLSAAGEIDLVAVEHGGLVIASSDMFFGSRNNLILPGRGINMGDGWETKRRRGPGHDWCILRLGAPGRIRRIEVDTAHYKGNFPESCQLEACNASGHHEDDLADSLGWSELLPRARLEADHVHRFESQVRNAGVVTHVRLNIFPDGGVSRLRLFGTLAEK